MRAAVATLSAAFLLGACAASGPIVVSTAAGRPASEVSRLVAASDTRVFPCAIDQVLGAQGAPVALGARWPSDVTLLPGRYRVALYCTNGAGHVVQPAADVTARAGKQYQVTGYLIDDSITVWNMKMRARVTELP